MNEFIEIYTNVRMYPHTVCAYSYTEKNLKRFYISKTNSHKI